MSSKNILVVSHANHLREWIVDVLSSHGFSVLQASSVEQARTICSAALSLIVLECTTDSRHSTAWLRSLKDAGYTVPIIVFSLGRLDANTFSYLRNILGVSLFIDRPVEDSSFIKQVQMLLPDEAAAADQSTRRRKIDEVIDHLFDDEHDDQSADDSSDQENDLQLDPGGSLTNSEVVSSRNQSGSMSAPPVIGAASAEERDEMSVMLEELQLVRQKWTALQTIAEKQEGFAQVLYEDWSKLGCLIELASPEDRSMIDQMHNLVHKIYSKAGYFGYTLVGDIAYRIEQLLLQLSSNEDELLGAKIWRQVVLYFDRGKGLVNAAVSMPKQCCPEHKFIPKVLLLSDSANFDQTIQLLSSSNIANIFRFDKLIDAFHRCQCEKFDIVLIDLDSAGNDNIPAACLNLRMALRKPVPIGVIYSSESDLDPVGIELAGISELIAAPVDNDVLAAAIYELLHLVREKKFKVLLVDNDRVLCQHLQSSLLEEPFEIVTLSDAGIIDRALAEFDPDILVLDEITVSHSGCLIARDLRDDFRYKDLPIIFLCNGDGPAAQLRAYEAGGNAALCKPIMARDLISTIEKNLLHVSRSVARRDVDIVTGTLLSQPFLQETASLLERQLKAGSKLTVGIIRVSDYYELVMRQGLGAVSEGVEFIGMQLQAVFAPDVLKCKWAQNSFAVAFPRYDTCIVKQALEKLAAALRRIQFRGKEGRFAMEIAVGVADTDSQRTLGGLVHFAHKCTVRGANQQYEKYPIYPAFAEILRSEPPVAGVAWQPQRSSELLLSRQVMNELKVGRLSRVVEQRAGALSGSSSPRRSHTRLAVNDKKKYKSGRAQKH